MTVVGLGTRVSGIAGPAKWAAVAVLSGLAGSGLTFALISRGGEPVQVIRPEPPGPVRAELPPPEHSSADTDLTRFVPKARPIGPQPPDAPPLAAPRESREPALPARNAAASERATHERTAPASIPSKKINLNSATASELELLPGVGPALAGRIIEHRRTNGPFRSVTDLDKVRGIGPKMLEKLAPLVRVD